MKTSRGFLCALVGVALTIFSWFGPWLWPAWPAFAVVQLTIGSDGAFDELEYTTRAAIIVALIAVNIATWGLAAYGATRIFDWTRAHRKTTSPSA